MSPRDALVYRTIVLRAEGDLKRDLRPWTGATIEDHGRMPDIIAELERSETEAESPPDVEEIPSIPAQAPSAPPMDSGEGDESEEGEDPDPSPSYVREGESYQDDWFDVWLTKQGIVAHICATCPFVVESDVANFFTSVDLEVVREHLHSHTSLEKEVVRLCVSLLRRTLPHPAYADSPTMGLPQEGFGSSRSIAHSLLVAVDRVFDAEGQALLYSRFMDDFVIGAGGADDGHRIIARLQREMEPLGLYPNTAKTRVVATSQFLEESMADENAFLEALQSELDELETGRLRQIELPEERVNEIVSRFLAHRDLADKPKRWDRVLRRYYSVLRSIGVGDFVSVAIDDLRRLPDSVTQLLEYIRSFPMQPATAEALLTLSGDVADLYGDVPLLALETIASSPNELSTTDLERVSTAVFEFIDAELANNARAERDLSDRMVAAAVPIVAKFGDTALQRGVVELIVAAREPKSHARIQASVVGAAIGLPDRDLTEQALPGLPWEDVLALHYLAALQSGDDRAIGVALNLLRPEVKLMPNRFHVHSRPLMLLPILSKVAPTKASAAANSSIKQLQKNPPRLRDNQAEVLLASVLSE